MLKTLGILLGGVFVGAVGAEVVHRKCPDTLDKVRTRTRKAISDAKEAFRNGYKTATQSKPATA